MAVLAAVGDFLCSAMLAGKLAGWLYFSGWNFNTNKVNDFE